MKKKKSILITGADGFIGKNLCVKLSESSEFTIFRYSRSDNFTTLEEKISLSDVIIHLASEIRPDKAEYFKRNETLLEKICSSINNLHKKIPIVFMSSRHVSENSEKNSYARSKYECEKILENFFEHSNNPVIIYRPPGVFGKWSKHNYNSVVSTFCYNVVNNISLTINGKNKIIDLIYVDDLLSQIVDLFQNLPEGVSYPEIKSVVQITLEELANLISSFHLDRKNLFVNNVGLGFVRNLYATYLSYLPPEQFTYNIPKYADERGYFAEILKTKSAGQFSFFTCKSGITRGQHYHHTKNEKFLVVSGKARFCFEHIVSKQFYEIETSHVTLQIVDTIPGWAHNITNIGDDELVVMVWANEVFDRENPDTFGYLL